MSGTAVLLQATHSCPGFVLVLELIQPCDMLQKSEHFSAGLALQAGSPWGQMSAGAGRRADEGRQQGQGRDSTTLSSCGSVLPLSSAANVNGQDVTVQLKSKGWVCLFVFPLASVVVVFGSYNQA